jgi:hypothetical protein
VPGLASLERTIARQRSRVRWLQEGDANTKLFHAIANGRRNKNFIPSVRVGDEIITDPDRKVEAFTDAYTELDGGSERGRETEVSLAPKRTRKNVYWGRVLNGPLTLTPKLRNN